MKNVTTATTTQKSISRQFSRRIENITPMRTGVSLDLGYDHPAYLAGSVHDKPVAVGDKISGSYRIEDGKAGQFARITEIASVTSATPHSQMSATVDIKNIEKIAPGYLIWSKNRRHKLPVFAPYRALKGIDIYKIQRVAVDYFRNTRGNLIAKRLEVLETK